MSMRQSKKIIPDDIKQRIHNHFCPPTKDETGALVKKGLVHVEECWLCGNLSWVSTETEAPTDVVINDRDLLHEAIHGQRCAVCNRMEHLHPEVYDFIIKVMRFQQSIDVLDAAPRGEPK